MGVSGQRNSLINQTNVSNRCYNAGTASQGHGIRGNVQFVTGNGFKQCIRWRSTWIYSSPDKGRNSGEWDVWPLWMLQRAFVVWSLPQFRDAPPLEESVRDALSPGYSF